MMNFQEILSVEEKGILQAFAAGGTSEAKVIKKLLEMRIAELRDMNSIPQLGQNVSVQLVGELVCARVKACGILEKILSDLTLPDRRKETISRGSFR